MRRRLLTRVRSQWRAMLVPAAFACGVAVICWFFGADVWHAIGLGAAGAVIGIAAKEVIAPGDVRDLRWPVEERRGARGSRNDVATLSWSLRAGWGSVGRTAEIRLRKLAHRRLLIEGLHLENPEHRTMIEARLGTSVYAVLARARPTGLRVRTMTACLDALDALEPTAYPVPRPRSGVWPLTLTRSRSRDTGGTRG